MLNEESCPEGWVFEVIPSTGPSPFMSEQNAALDSNTWNEVVTFWFEELTPKQWFVSPKDVDQTIRNRFGDLWQTLATNPAFPPVTALTLKQCGIASTEDLLGAILVTDQFSRNLNRGDGQAFSTDEQALALSKYLVSTVDLKSLTTEQAQFAIMPYMHSEALSDQDQCVSLFTKLAITKGIPSAIEHRDIIRRFGRFPHRNAVLDRPSTAAEKDYLTDAKTFGQ